MKISHVAGTLLVCAAFGAHAEEPHAKTRAQVRAELAEAVRTGDFNPGGESGLTLRELYPQRYPAAPVVAGKTRAQVEAELAEAIRTGDVLAGGDSGLTLRELYPQRYPAAPAVAGKTRAQVKAELAEAIRIGDILAGGDSGLTLRELYPQRYPAPTTTTASRPDEPMPHGTDHAMPGDAETHGSLSQPRASP